MVSALTLCPLGTTVNGFVDKYVVVGGETHVSPVSVLEDSVRITRQVGKGSAGSVPLISVKSMPNNVSAISAYNLPQISVTICVPLGANLFALYLRSKTEQ